MFEQEKQENMFDTDKRPRLLCFLYQNQHTEEEKLQIGKPMTK